ELRRASLGGHAPAEPRRGLASLEAGEGGFELLGRLADDRDAMSVVRSARACGVADVLDRFVRRALLEPLDVGAGESAQGLWAPRRDGEEVDRGRRRGRLR